MSRLIRRWRSRVHQIGGPGDLIIPRRGHVRIVEVFGNMLVGAAPEGGSGRGYRNLPPEAGYDNVFGDVLPQETKDVMGGLWGTTSNNSVTFRGPYPYHDEPVAGEAIACSFDNFPGGAFVLEWKGSSQPLYQEDVPGFATWLDGEVGNWQPFRLARTDAIRNSVDSTWVVTNELG